MRDDEHVFNAFEEWTSEDSFPSALTGGVSRSSFWNKVANRFNHPYALLYITSSFCFEHCRFSIRVAKSRLWKTWNSLTWNRWFIVWICPCNLYCLTHDAFVKLIIVPEENVFSTVEFLHVTFPIWLLKDVHLGASFLESRYLSELRCLLSSATFCQSFYMGEPQNRQKWSNRPASVRMFVHVLETYTVGNTKT